MHNCPLHINNTFTQSCSADNFMCAALSSLSFYLQHLNNAVITPGSRYSSQSEIDNDRPFWKRVNSGNYSWGSSTHENTFPISHTWLFEHFLKTRGCAAMTSTAALQRPLACRLKRERQYCFASPPWILFTFFHPVAKNCAELHESGNTTSGVYKINPDDEQAFDVFCDQTTAGGGWTVFQKRLDGSVDFYRNWTDYKQGFGNLTGEFWLGLDKIHRLTSQTNNKLRVELEDFEGKTAYAEYDTFAVADEADNYRLSTGDYINAGKLICPWGLCLSERRISLSYSSERKRDISQLPTHTCNVAWRDNLKVRGRTVSRLTLSFLRVINAKFPLQPNRKYYITQYGELDFS